MTPDFPSWTLPVIAIALVVIALVMVAIAVAGALMLKNLGDTMQQQRAMLAEWRGLLDTAKTEVEAIVRTSRGVRKLVVKGVKRTRSKLLDLEDLYDVVHGEVEETALDVAATLRGFRRGSGVLRRLKRLVVPGR